MEEVSNVRPLAIFSGYMVTAAVLTAACISIIRGGLSRQQRQPWPQRKLALTVFSLLAAFSLGMTWYHMFRFFGWSYNEWKARQIPGLLDPDVVHLGRWLRETKLFQQAWATVLDSPSRSWWSLQIFGFCANWSVMLADQERRRGIPHLWLFMLLAQVVAVSFASNLFFLAVAAYSPDGRNDNGNEKGSAAGDEDDDDDGDSASSFWYDAVIIVTVSLALGVPAAVDQAHFLRLLLMPHLLGFAPLLLNRALPKGSSSSTGPGWPRMATYTGAMATVVGFATFAAVSEEVGADLYWNLLHDHPAVSSVGWDVVCCTVSYSAWYLLHRNLREWIKSTQGVRIET
ncbi:hypothetical protein GMORB2_3972 [Geosmithia morbida]|uniref:Alpha-mannosyltransferase alg11p n=1 Tax=Geosmithia morbida TaxID=1094350 RepID=A0A9P5D2J2_9HYPO|nr:uncharacterized protein GMORB2_3972 [Geosmithia morbida]KAF4125133.1 hypothetical protein GMORB2_3972 [Geosmithia morbida]